MKGARRRHNNMTFRCVSTELWTDTQEGSYIKMASWLSDVAPSLRTPSVGASVGVSVGSAPYTLISAMFASPPSFETVTLVAICPPQLITAAAHARVLEISPHNCSPAKTLNPDSLSAQQSHRLKTSTCEISIVVARSIWIFGCKSLAHEW